MIEHHLFPTLVCQFKYDKHEEFRNTFYRDVWNHMTPEGFSAEFTGHVAIHHEPSFEPLFRYAVSCAKQYTQRLHIDDVFEFNVVKTWLNIKKDSSTPTHAHGDAHISFTYYVNIPDDFTRPIRFYNYERRHEPYPGSIRWNNSNGIWDQLNSMTWQFEPTQGDLFVFPATLTHDTIGKQMDSMEGATDVEGLNKNRICLAGDILLTYKQSAAKPLGLQPIENWKRFE